MYVEYLRNMQVKVCNLILISISYLQPRMYENKRGLVRLWAGRAINAPAVDALAGPFQAAKSSAPCASDKVFLAYERPIDSRCHVHDETLFVGI